ncbi:DUF6586 family protein [Pistricoccus aurantiacus]|uniref:DUF6586 family protein n=1 Tax=Pistricoccus aurantiacus TaxID=1883414 RepID=UPI00362F845B
MTPSGRTNQLLYQAELLLTLPDGEDEHAPGRRRASLEGALAMTELALDSLLREVTEHTGLQTFDWRRLLRDSTPAPAEISHLRELAAEPDSWLSQLLTSLEALHGCDGVSPGGRPGVTAMIATAGPSPGERLSRQLREFKALLAAFRESSREW